jgi:hypothetical protein
MIKLKFFKQFSCGTLFVKDNQYQSLAINRYNNGLGHITELNGGCYPKTFLPGNKK